jgi:hypothetical protein
VLVLVLGCRDDPYPMLIETIKATWASIDVEGVDVVFYYGGTERAAAGRDVFLPVPDDLAHVGDKTLTAFECVLERREFDVLFRTNCSSYVDLHNLLAFVKARGRRSGFYAGLVGGHAGTRFASGSGYFLSRDLVDLAVSRRAEYDRTLLDDVALGSLLEAAGVKPEPTPRRDYASPRDVEEVDLSQFHFRCRTSSPARVDDARIMLELHRAFCSSRGLGTFASRPRARTLETLGAAWTRLRLRAGSAR